MELSELLEFSLEETFDKPRWYPLIVQVLYLLNDDSQYTEVTENVFLY